MTIDSPVRDAVSAGGVVWRRRPDGAVEIVLCGRTNEGLWCLPKGTPDRGESVEQAALREVREETGLEVARGEKLGIIRYWFTAGGVRFRKRVHHWLFQQTGGDMSDHDHEFDAVRWAPIAEAHRLVKYENERAIIAEAARRLEVDL